MTPYQARALHDMSPELTTYVNADDITGRLLSEKAISMHDLDRIYSCHTRYDKMAMLLNIILHPDSPPGQSPYQALLNALGENYLTLVQQISQKCEQYQGDNPTVAQMKGACRVLADGGLCDVTQDGGDFKRSGDYCCDAEQPRKKIRLESDYSMTVKSDHQQEAEKVISTPMGITAKKEPEESKEDDGYATKGDKDMTLVPIRKRQVLYGTHLQGHRDMQTRLPTTLLSSVDFPSKKMARFVYQLQRQMGDSLDHCAWDQLENCAQQVRGMFAHEPQVLAIVHMFLGLREGYQGNPHKCRANSREVLRAYRLGPTVSIVMQGIRILSCLRLCRENPEARQEGLIAIREGRQMAHFLPPCPEKGRLMMVSGMLLGQLYNHIPEYQNEATRQEVLHLFQESLRMYSAYNGPGRILGVPKALIQFATFLVQCRLNEEGNLIPQHLSDDDRNKAKAAFQRVAELELDKPPYLASKVARLSAEVDYYIDIGAYEKAQELTEKLEKMVVDSGIKMFGAHTVQSRKKFLRDKVVRHNVRERSDALLAQAATVTTS